MIAFLRNVALILFLSLALPFPIAILLHRSAVSTSMLDAGVASALLVLFLFTLPGLALYGWARSRLGEVERLADRARLIAAGRHDLSATDESQSLEVAALARAVEELRATVIGRHELLDRQTSTLKEIAEGSEEGLLVIDRGHRVVMVNQRLADLFELELPITGRRFLEVIRSATLATAIDRSMEGARVSVQMELPAGKAARRIALRTVPLSAGSGLAVAAYFEDVTRLEHLERVRRDFITDFSHEVRTPLAGLRSAAESLESRSPSPEQTDQLVKILGRQVARLERLVCDLGELSQIESGEAVLQVSTTDLSVLAREVCDDYRERAGSMEIGFEGQSTLAEVDPGKIQQVLSNLLDNALKHSNGRSVEVLVDDGPSTARIHVSDDGEGIPEAEQERIFHRFYRLDRSRSQSPQGTGLGLAITKHLILLHGGSISVESRPGQGATFEVHLPKSKADSSV